MKTDKELAEEIDKLKGTGRELEGTVPIRGTGSKSPRAVISLRMGSDELNQIEAAAREAHVNISEYIRESALVRSESYWQGRIGSHVARLLGEVRAIEDSLQGIKDGIPEAFKLAPEGTDRGELIAEDYRVQVDAKFDELMALRKSLDEFWKRTA